MPKELQGQKRPADVIGAAVKVMRIGRSARGVPRPNASFVAACDKPRLANIGWRHAAAPPVCCVYRCG
jgi:hypothetical protein